MRTEGGKVMKKALAVIGTAAIGAGVMFFADPKSGKSRLSAVGKGFAKAGKWTGRFVKGRSINVKNGVCGLYSVTTSRFRGGSQCEAENPRTRQVS
jgi:hypothetical protein